MLTGLGISRGVQLSEEAQGLVLCLGAGRSTQQEEAESTGQIAVPWC